MTYKFDALNPEDHVFIPRELWIPAMVGEVKILRQYGQFVLVRPVGVQTEAYPLGPVIFPCSASSVSNPSS